MKLAACFTQDWTKSLEVVQKMLRAQCLRDFHEPHSFALKGGAIGYVATCERYSSVPLFRQSPNGNLLMMSGVPINLRGSLEQTLHKLVGPDGDLAPQVLAELDGAFAALFWDNSRQKLTIVTDFLGMQPLYIVHGDGLLLLATETKGIAAGGLIDQDLDSAGWGSLLARGHMLGGHTLLQGVKRVDAASVLSWDTARGKLEFSQYWRWPERRPIQRVEDVDTGELLELLRGGVRGYSAHYAGGTVLLSGGLDSRLISSLLLEEQLQPKALILEHPDEFINADGKFGVEAARQLRIEYEVARPQPDHFSSEAYFDYLIMNEVTTPSLYLFIAQVSAHLRSDMKAIWEGVATGTTLNAYGQPPGGFSEYLRGFPKDRAAAPWVTRAAIFDPRLVGQMYETFWDVVEKEKARYSDDEYGAREFHIRNKSSSRNAPNPLLVYANDVLPFTPGYDREFFSLAVNIPAQLKLDRSLLLEVYRRHYPEAARVPFCSGSALLNPFAWYDPCKYTTAARLRVMRLYTNWYFRSIRQRIGFPLFSWQPSSLVDWVVSRVNPDHPDLNPDSVRRLQLQHSAMDSTMQAMRETLFYWQVWRWVMDGTATTRKKEHFHSGSGPSGKPALPTATHIL